MASDSGYTYAKAGVSIDAGNALVRAIGPLVKATRRPGADADLEQIRQILPQGSAGSRYPAAMLATMSTD